MSDQNSEVLLKLENEFVTFTKSIFDSVSSRKIQFREICALPYVESIAFGLDANKAKCLMVGTAPVVIQNEVGRYYALGQFIIMMSREYKVTTIDKPAHFDSRLIIVSANMPSGTNTSGEPKYHPHISQSGLLCSDANETIFRLIREGDIINALEYIWQALNTYTPRNPYIQLEDHWKPM